MTEERTQPDPAAATPEPEIPPTEPRSPASFEERVEAFGREAEGVGKRLAANPAVVDAADTAARTWGLLVLAVGLWFFAEFTLGMDMPAIPWRDIWPLGLILIGVAVLVRGLRRGNA